MANFINFSNHPSINWSVEQLEKASENGEIVDIAFPEVDPDLDEEGIDKLAAEYVKKIMKYDIAVVMAQGEFTLCYAVVNKLKENNIRVIAACSQRITREEGNKRISEFNFVRFREY